MIFETGHGLFHALTHDGAKFMKITFRNIFGVVTGMGFYSVETRVDEAGLSAHGCSEDNEQKEQYLLFEKHDELVNH